MFKFQHCLKGAALMLVLTILAFAQTTPAKLSVVIGEHKIKFTPSGQSQELRLEVHNNVGELIYDSGALAEADLNWNLQTGNGRPLVPGLYAYTLSIKAPDAAEPQKHQGHLIIEKGGNRIWLTTKSEGATGAEVAGDELLVARDSERTTAGTGYAATGRVLAERIAQGRSLTDEKNGVTQANAQSTVNLSGTGTTNRLAKWVDGPQGVLGNSIITEVSSGKIGIGKTNPGAKLHVAAGESQFLEASRISGRFPSLSFYVESQGETPADRNWAIGGPWFREGDFAIFQSNAKDGDPRNAGTARLYFNPTGNVGIGTTEPQAKLDVRGNVKLGNSGELFAASGGENLRIVRGVIDQNGNIIVGSGFTVVGSNGEFRIVFTTPFSAAPAVTVTAHLDTAGGGTVAMTRGVLGNFADIILCSESSNSVCTPRKGAFHFIAIGPR